VRSGDPIGAAEALKVGVVDQVVDGDLLQGAVAFARTKIGKPRRTRDLNDKLVDEAGNLQAFAAARDNAKKKQRNLMAPQAAINAVEASTKMTFDEGVKREAELFQECLFSDQSKALIHMFSARGSQQIPGIPKDIRKSPFRKLLLSARAPWRRHCDVLANAGIPVLLKETDQRRSTADWQRYARTTRIR